FKIRSHDDCVPRYRHRKTEPVVETGVGRFEISLLTPGGPVAHENVGRTCKHGAVIRLVTIDPGSLAGFTSCADDHGTARNRYRLEGTATICVGNFEIGLLRGICRNSLLLSM